MIHDSASFLQSCEQQGFKTRRGVEDIPLGSFGHPADPTGLLNVLISARMTLENEPEKPLARPNLRGMFSRHRQLDLEPFSGDVVATALGRMINCSISAAPLTSDTYAFSTSTSNGGYSCNKVESNFINVLNGLVSGEPTPCEVYDDDSGNPVLIRKGAPAGYKVALSLAKVSINNKLYAPLSVMRLTAQDDPRHSGPNEPLASESLAVRPLTDISHLSYARPSAFGMSEEEVRARFPDLDVSHAVGYDHDTIREIVQMAVS